MKQPRLYGSSADAPSARINTALVFLRISVAGPLVILLWNAILEDAFYVCAIARKRTGR